VKSITVHMMTVDRVNEDTSVSKLGIVCYTTYNWLILSYDRKSILWVCDSLYTEPNATLRLLDWSISQWGSVYSFRNLFTGTVNADRHEIFTVPRINEMHSDMCKGSTDHLVIRSL
jgi:hypothetical protein